MLKRRNRKEKDRKIRHEVGDWQKTIQREREREREKKEPDGEVGIRMTREALTDAE